MSLHTITYVTTNGDKVTKANINLREYGIVAVQKHMELLEQQSFDGEAIVRQKVAQAFAAVGLPVLANDDSWVIPALNGFPAANMKMCNHFLQAQDWLRLMHGVDDRRIFLRSYYAVHSGGEPAVFIGEDEMYFLPEARGLHPKAPCLEVVAWKGSQTSIAEDIASGAVLENQNKPFWKKIAAAIIGTH